MAAAACSSLILPSKTSPSLRLFFSLPNPTTSLTTTLQTPLTKQSSSLLLSASFVSSLVPKVALQPDYELAEEEEDGVVQLGGEEELEGEDDDDESSAERFSPELKLFVGNLPFSVDSAELAGLFERVGNVEMVEVIYDKMTGKSRGFGFVTMSTVDEVEAAAEQFNGYELKGRALRVNSGPPPPRDEFSSRGPQTGAAFDSPNRVYVGNLPWGCDNLALETLFSEQGKVMEAKVVYDRESGRSRGFGFVTYSTAEEVSNAISSLDGFDFDGRPIRVTMAEARPRR